MIWFFKRFLKKLKLILADCVREGNRGERADEDDGPASLDALGEISWRCKHLFLIMSGCITLICDFVLMFCQLCWYINCALTASLSIVIMVALLSVSFKVWFSHLWAGAPNLIFHPTSSKGRHWSSPAEQQPPSHVHLPLPVRLRPHRLPLHHLHLLQQVNRIIIHIMLVMGISIIIAFLFVTFTHQAPSSIITMLWLPASLLSHCQFHLPQQAQPCPQPWGADPHPHLHHPQQQHQQDLRVLHRLFLH